ncbi:hypothetical protein DVDV_1540 [Desulfovibrio sp. DV]|nr:hypothetical protein DVDV_1540 [Desulfovibrio sp. DV]
MLSDANLPEEVRNSTAMRQYTGGYDCLAGYKDRTYPLMEQPAAMAG